MVPALQRWLSINNVEVLLINGGVSGNTTLGGAEQLDWLLSPDINGVVVALGGNDLLRGFDPEFTKNNFRRIMDAGGDTNKIDGVDQTELTSLMDQMRQRGKKEREIYELIVGSVKIEPL